MARNWFPEERQRQADLCRAQKPWENSTGPRTDAGKAACKNNAYKHGFHSGDMREVRRLLRAQRDFVRAVMAGLGTGGG